MILTVNRGIFSGRCILPNTFFVNLHNSWAWNHNQLIVTILNLKKQTINLTKKKNKKIQSFPELLGTCSSINQIIKFRKAPEKLYSSLKAQIFFLSFFLLAYINCKDSISVLPPADHTCHIGNHSFKGLHTVPRHSSCHVLKD